MPSSRKAALGRDGVTEENWILLTAQEVVESNILFAKMRRERLEGTGGGTTSGAAASGDKEKEKEKIAPATGTPQPHPAAEASRAGTPATTKAQPPPPPPPAPVPTLAPVISIEGLSQSALRALRMSARRPAEGSAAIGATGTIAPTRKTKVPKASSAGERPKGVYEPHTGLMHCTCLVSPIFALWLIVSD